MKFCPKCEVRLKKGNSKSVLSCPKCGYTQSSSKDTKKGKEKEIKSELNVLMRNLIGKATPKEYAEVKAALIAAISRVISTIEDCFALRHSEGRPTCVISPHRSTIAHFCASRETINVFYLRAE